MWASCFLEFPMDSPTGFQSPLPKAIPHLHQSSSALHATGVCRSSLHDGVAYGLRLKNSDAKTDLNVKLAFIPQLKHLGIPARLAKEKEFENKEWAMLQLELLELLGFLAFAPALVVALLIWIFLCQHALMAQLL